MFLHENTQPKESLYVEKNASSVSKSLTLPGLASVFPQGIMWISALCAICDCLFTFSQRKLAATVCLGLPIQARASADLDLCLSPHSKTFHSPHKK